LRGPLLKVDHAAPAGAVSRSPEPFHLERPVMPHPFDHLELNTDDLPKAKKFYKKVFAWQLVDVKGTPYTMIHVDGEAVGGMQKKPMPEAPTAWLPYVTVDDVKKTLAKAAKAGGSVLLEHHPIGTNGAIGVLMDPGGAALGIWETSQSAPKAAAKKAKPAAKAKAKPAAKAKKPAAKAKPKKR
jgi:predicted enzyme related to lactoylglutathione lyase